ncbi:CHAP domain-containing protein [Deinococcus sp. HMF7604]|uniref:CHAP domain-containing protein n=1 Tax=Deinococcus betulae TaxID=2873312 RepID=UPI001CCD0769|nr:CHAP domain-containing protein [Deinococcus betulae]MBZ9752662.1 CHAP domain-containing protein [Deinococcus betulae]
MLTREPALSADSGASAPKPQAPAKPAALKKAPKKWERTFLGKGKGVQFQLRLIRDETGHLHGRYMAKPGQGGGWHVEGILREDNTFAVKGTENNAVFEGRFSPDGRRITTSFTNETESGKFHVESMAMGFVVMPKGYIPGGAQQGGNGSGGQNGSAGSDTPQEESTEVTAAEAQAAINAAKSAAAAMGKPFKNTSPEHAKNILEHCKKQGITTKNQIAYILATGVWESDGYTAFREKYDSGWTPEEYFEQKYGCNPTKTLRSDKAKLDAGKSVQSILASRKNRNISELGNTNPGDGYKYRGRGYVHLTGKANYARAQKEIIIPSSYKIEGKVPDIVENPDLASTDFEIAGMIIVKGMMTGLFTGKKLGDYINGNVSNFRGARSVVNGSDAASVIAGGALSATHHLKENLSGQQDGGPSNNSYSLLSENQKNAIEAVPQGGYTQEELKRMRSGIEIGRFKGIPAHYNGPVEAETWGTSFGEGGVYYGYKWQCVEFVRRFTHLNSGKYISYKGNAGTFYKTTISDGATTFDGFIQNRNWDLKTGQKLGSKNKPKIGDILVIRTATFGHVAIVSEVNEDSITIVQQNVETKFQESISLTNISGRWKLGGDVVCWLSQ